MDPITLAALTALATKVVGILTPFFSKAGEAFASKFGDAAYQEAQHLYQIVHDRFAKEPDNGRANKALQNFADDPQTYDTVLKNMLLPILQSDSHFADALTAITQKGPLQILEIGTGSTAKGTQMENTAGQGVQIARAGDHSILENNIFKIN